MNRPRGRLSTGTRLLVLSAFIPTLAVALALWILMLCLFIIPLFIVYLIRRHSGKLSYNSKAGRPDPGDACNLYVQHDEGASNIPFDRTNDVSKIIGCNTRNVQYRWDVFDKALNKLTLPPEKPVKALDFGAGCLRESYHLASLGIHVDAVDLDVEQLKLSYDQYDWSSLKSKPVMHDAREWRSNQSGREYDLILAFDVLEHVHALDDTVELLRDRLTADGMMFVTVPNRVTLFERYWRMENNRRRRNGVMDTSGGPHVNFKTPREWKRFFSGKGFVVDAHEMGIGFFVNDMWQGLFGVPIRLFQEPIVRKGAALAGWNYKPRSFETIFYPRWLMKYANELDEALKSVLKERWAWNLFVLRREP
ncbi:MAG: class I SAM-dependent methyltransferase [Candidatus Eisenbacteria bacterium]|uniref:Class I SAM-dependent methyltransferase n=1 Tax=Eiseniibacteriota bacterium TaxID=2212470 RepID=A0A948W677_UNCEI|nr:class I SAM-dependent methyltransferase [Candidatus Eisenbacteria bacterium]MBU1948054.1 class I SAM-dependent methyltransferase [Candidatus Eisenbacteria bacterium]MBU2690820.1 class I SAM-dependent methyltransferase [Candidatus Eisenbacteria bacterium]